MNQSSVVLRTRSALGWASALTLGLTAWLGLVVTPPDVIQRDAVRLLYLHVPTAWLAMYVSFGVTTLASALYLWRRTRKPFWDLVAGASAEIGVVFIGLTLMVGSVWGRSTWGVWWTWDARLTTTAVLFVMYLGYLAVRRLPSDPEVRARRSALVALAAFVNVPIVHQSVVWWRTLHQKASVLDPERVTDPQITGTMAGTLVLGVVAFTLLYVWLLMHRYQVAVLEQRFEDEGLEIALAERRAEAADGSTADGAADGSTADGSTADGRSASPTEVAP